MSPILTAVASPFHTEGAILVRDLKRWTAGRRRNYCAIRRGILKASAQKAED
jgi:hypothetical protein